MAQIDWIRANLPHDLHVSPMLAIAYRLSTSEIPRLGDIRVRRALNLAYDREPVVEKILKLGEPAAYHGYVPPGVANYPGGAAMDFPPLPYPRPAGGGPQADAGGGLWPLQPVAPDFFDDHQPDLRRAAAAFQAMMTQIYVDLRIQNSDQQIFFASLRQHQFQIGRAVWLADFNDASNFLDLLRSDAGNNYAGYQNPKYDAALDAALNQLIPQNAASFG